MLQSNIHLGLNLIGRQIGWLASNARHQPGGWQASRTARRRYAQSQQRCRPGAISLLYSQRAKGLIEPGTQAVIVPLHRLLGNHQLKTRSLQQSARREGTLKFLRALPRLVVIAAEQHNEIAAASVQHFSS